MSITAINFSNIQWDTDGEQINLPEEHEEFFPNEHFDPQHNWAILLDDTEMLADFLSEEFGFCIFSFKIRTVRRSLRNYNRWKTSF
jgi:hypothetical protein